MSQPRISMHRLQDLVRLHRMGKTPTQVARLLAMTRTTERAYRRAFEAEGLLTGPPDDLPTQETLAAALARRRPPKEPAQQVSTAEPGGPAGRSPVRWAALRAAPRP